MDNIGGNRMNDAVSGLKGGIRLTKDIINDISHGLKSRGSPRDENCEVVSNS